MAETQDTGVTPAQPVDSAPAAPAPASAPAPAAPESSAPVIVKIASRLNYSVPIELSDGETVSLPHHGVRSIEKSKLTDAKGEMIALPAGVFVVGD